MANAVIFSTETFKEKESQEPNYNASDVQSDAYLHTNLSHACKKGKFGPECSTLRLYETVLCLSLSLSLF